MNEAATTSQDLMGGTLAMWDHVPAGQPIGQALSERHLTRYDENGVKVDRIVPSTTAVSMIGDNGVAYSVTGNGFTGLVWAAMDVVTWQQKWTLPSWPVMALDGGGVVTHDGAELKVLDGNGVLQSTTAMSFHWTESVVKYGEWISANQDNSHIGEPTRSIVGPDAIRAMQSFSAGNQTLGQAAGNPFLQSATYLGCEPKVPFVNHYKPPPGPTIWYRFDGTWSADRPELKLAVLDAIALWNMSNETQGFTQLRFAAATAEDQLPMLEFSNVVPPTAQQHRDYASAVGEMVPVEKYPSNQLKKMQIYITWDPTYLHQTPRMYRKTALHEVGHVFGLAENSYFSPLKRWEDRNDPTIPQFLKGMVFGKSGSSVMNYPSDRGDHQGWMPDRFVTPCDSRRAKAKFLEQ